MPTSQDPIVLHQFAFSHFNEKARWALDWKGLAYTPHNVLPGFHTKSISKLSPGSTSTPVLEHAGTPVAGSAAIVEYVDSLNPYRALFPVEPEARAEVEGWIEWLDDEVGPASRCALFHEILDDPAYASRLFSTGQPGIKAFFYHALFPKMVPVLRSRMSIDDDSAHEARQFVMDGLKRIEEATRATGYLVGDAFTAADLTAACLLFPLFFPPELGFSMPDRESAAYDAWRASWQDAPAKDYVLRMWTDHR